MLMYSLPNCIEIFFNFSLELTEILETVNNPLDIIVIPRLLQRERHDLELVRKYTEDYVLHVYIALMSQPELSCSYFHLKNM